jgi:ribosomal-protein-alanine N-acetyltransferase
MELITERLILRELKYSDWPDVLAYQSDPLYLRYYDWAGRTPEAVQEFVRMLLSAGNEYWRSRRIHRIIPCVRPIS